MHALIDRVSMQSYDRATSTSTSSWIGRFGSMPGITGPAESHTQILEQGVLRWDTWRWQLSRRVLNLVQNWPFCGSIFKSLTMLQKLMLFHFSYPRDKQWNATWNPTQNWTIYWSVWLLMPSYLVWSVKSYSPEPGWVWSLSLLLHRHHSLSTGIFIWDLEEFPTHPWILIFWWWDYTGSNPAAINLPLNLTLHRWGHLHTDSHRVAFGLEKWQLQSFNLRTVSERKI